MYGHRSIALCNLFAISFFIARMSKSEFYRRKNLILLLFVLDHLYRHLVPIKKKWLSPIQAVAVILVKKGFYMPSILSAANISETQQFLLTHKYW
jgi:hypothetical protein